MQPNKMKKGQSSQKLSFAVYAIWLLKNILFLFIVVLLVKYTFSKQPAYNWVYNGLLKGNMEMIRKYPNLTYDQKMQYKLGASYEYLLFLKQHTPENAVILYPSSKAFRKKDSPFTQNIDNKIYAIRFLYPRKLILESDLENSIYADKITHVAIVNGEGIDKLPYPVNMEIQHGVLPVIPQKN